MGDPPSCSCRGPNSSVALAVSSDERIRVICGPTAGGKSATAMTLSQVADISIVSADSRQLYRGFDVGTGNPTSREQLAVPHCGIDALDPTERASAAWWSDQADRWVDEVAAEGRTPVVVGGTGLYLRALFGTLFTEPPMDPEDRAAVQASLAEHTTEELRRRVTELDPERAHLGRTQLLRAIEVVLLTGRRVSDLHRENATAPRRRARYLVVDPGPVLAQVIESRVNMMLELGWKEEVEHLIRAVPADAPAWNASGYRTVREAVEGRLTSREMLDRVVIETRQYAKRQRTWFRHQLARENVTRLNPRDDDFPERLMDWWKEVETSA
ncbi:MAG: tRNA (adenosine(37)-N6)-dimethylallyltransferase MiaA [bacterium]